MHVVELSPHAHDQALALTSHLPHAAAAALVTAVPDDLEPLTAGAYRDGTRVAASDTELWTGIFLENRVPLIRALEGVQNQFQALQQALIEGDEAYIRTWWDAARNRRLKTMGSDPGEPF
jgi:prephenate dehydrogenase